MAITKKRPLGVTLAALPRELEGVDCVEWLIINDGSTDQTVEVARQHGADHVVNLPHNQGLAKAFMAGIEACLKAGADIIVNTDADNQYRADDIPELIKPILNGEAQMVVGARPIDEIKHFSPAKKLLQRLGSWVVRVASNSDIYDAPSGFRAHSREAALHLNVFNHYTYTLETIIQAGRQGFQMVLGSCADKPRATAVSFGQEHHFIRYSIDYYDISNFYDLSTNEVFHDYWQCSFFNRACFGRSVVISTLYWDREHACT